MTTTRERFKGSSGARAFRLSRVSEAREVSNMTRVIRERPATTYRRKVGRYLCAHSDGDEPSSERDEPGGGSTE